MGRPFSYIVWTVIELLSVIFTLGGVAMVFVYFNGDEYAKHGFELGALIKSAGLVLFGLVSYQMARSAKKSIRKKTDR